MSVYAVGDLHGMLDLYKQIKAFLKPEDKVYCLGDCGDRGPQPWETIKAIATDPQFIYIKGNHEDMLVNAMDEYLNGHSGDSLYLLARNGGLRTFNDWVADGAKPIWQNYLKNLPIHLRYRNSQGYNIELSHAGFTPGTFPKDNDLIWDRDHFYDDPLIYNTISVHGHTPIQLMIEGCPDLIKWFGADEDSYESGAFWYCKAHKVNIDTGAYATGQIVLLDLDTFDEHIFSVKEEEAYECE